MIRPTYDWQFAINVTDEAFLKAAKKEGLEPSAANLLYQRGVQSLDSLTAILTPNLE